MNINPVVAVEYSKEAFADKCKKAISKFIDTYLVFFQMPIFLFLRVPSEQNQLSITSRGALQKQADVFLHMHLLHLTIILPLPDKPPVPA